MSNTNESSRTDRVAAQIQRELATLLHHGVKDQRLKLITISTVEVTRDLSYAKVYITVLDPKLKDEVVSAANKAGGHLRNKLASALKLRTTPQLKFVYDESIEHGAKLSALIDKAISKDNNQ